MQNKTKQCNICVQTRLMFDLHVKPSDTKRIRFASKVVGGLYMGYIGPNYGSNEDDSISHFSVSRLLLSDR